MKLEGNEIISIDDYDILYSYYDCWKCKTERLNAVFQGIVEADCQTENAIKHRINAGNKAYVANDITVASIYDNRFCIPLEFEILESSLPLYQYGLGSHLTYELTFADYSDVIKATKERSATKFTRDTEEFFNPKIIKVEVTVEGVPNELYAQNMEYHHQYDEIVKHFAEGCIKEAGAIQKDLQLHNVNISPYYTDKYALWLDFRTIDDNRLHGSGRQLENTSESIRLQITKESGSVGKLSCYLYIFQDAQINISDAQFLNVVY